MGDPSARNLGFGRCSRVPTRCAPCVGNPRGHRSPLPGTKRLGAAIASHQQRGEEKEEGGEGWWWEWEVGGSAQMARFLIAF